MIVYFDSSALVTLLVEEEGSDLAATLWNGCDAAVSSRLAYPEVCAALAAAHRSHRLDSRQHQRAQAHWEDYWAAVRPVELSADITRHSGRLTAEHTLRGADAVHLASVLAIGDAATVFAVWDQRLRDAADELGIRLAPP